MVNFDKFEKRVKETYGNQEFPFDEQNWEKAGKMIDASRQGKNRGGIFLLSAVALLCTTGLVYYFGFSDSADALKKNNLASNELTNKELVLKSETSETAPVENGNVNQSNNEAATSNSTNENVNDNAVSGNTSSNLTGTSKNNSSVTLTKTKSAKTVTETSIQSTTNETKAEEKTNSSSDANETKASTPSKTNAKKPETVKSNSKNTTPPVLGSNNSNNPNTTVVKENPIGGTGNSDKEGNTNTPTDPAKNGTVIDSSNSILVVGVMPSTESIVTDSTQTITQMPVDSFKFPEIPKGDGISYATNVKMEHNHKNFLFMEAGAVYLFGWNGGENTDANGFNLAAGLNFQHYFTNNFSVQIGVQYSSIGNITKTSYTINTVNYDLGIEKDITSIKYQKLHYLVAPIKFALNAGKDNIIGIGCNVGYLLNSESKKEKYKTYSNDPNAIKNNLTSSKETGYVQGFNPIDVQVSAFYRRKIYKGLSANAEFIFGLTDTKNNNFFKSNTFERTTGFKLTLCYDLFKK